MSRGDEVQVLSRDETIEQLWHQNYRGLVRLSAGLTGDVGTAEEVVQEAFAALLRRWGSIRDPSATYAYLLRVVTNEARARCRRRRASLETVPRLSGDSVIDTDVDARLDVMAALARLSYGKRACLLLRYYADLSQAETANVLGVSVGTIKSQTAKGLRELSEILNASRIETR